MKLHRLVTGLFAAALLLSSFTLPAAEPDAGVWIDVRTVEEHRESSIPDHPNILYTEIGDRITSVTADKDAPVYLYCRSGRRAGIAKETLEQMGYTNVTNAGGIDDVRKLIAPPQ